MTDRISADHLKRAALVYVRQSKPEQVRSHAESTRIQLGLREQAVAFGWRHPVTITDDLGISAGGFAERAGFQHMAAEVSLGNVGIRTRTSESREGGTSQAIAVLVVATPVSVAYPSLGIVGVFMRSLCRGYGPPSAADYRPRDAEHAVLYRVIDEHLEAFLDTAKRHADGSSLPQFVEQEFRDFLTCGVLAHGFARLRCTDCTCERLVPFSCKGRGFCPSCGGRRMTECAARLVEDVLPRVPVRQWVLSLPYRLRYLLAWDHVLARAVLGVSVRVLLGFQRHRARRYAIRDGRSGCVTVIQRFGGGLNLNLHFHALLFDGVFFAEGKEGTLGFRPLPPPTDEEVGIVLARIAARVQRLLKRRGLDPGDADLFQADPVVQESPALAGTSRTTGY